jgi:spore coat protein CotH
LKIIGWDFDLSFDGTGPTDLTLESFDGRWPLLQAVARDPVFARAYLDQLDAVLAAEFDSGVLLERVDEYEALIADAVAREDTVRPGIVDSFEQGLSALRAHIEGQQEALQAHLEAVGLR